MFRRKLIDLQNFVGRVFPLVDLHLSSLVPLRNTEISKRLIFSFFYPVRYVLANFPYCDFNERRKSKKSILPGCTQQATSTGVQSNAHTNTRSAMVLV